MNEQDQHKIARENRAEVQRAKTGLSSRDWGIVLGALIIAALVLGFIYTANNPGNVEPALEPAAGSTASTANEAATDDDIVRNQPAVPPTDVAPMNTETPSTDNPDAPVSQDTPDISPNPAD
jgi:hypothetical protein